MRTMQPLAAVNRLAGAAVLGTVLGLVLGVLTDPLLGVLSGIAGTATLFVVTGWFVLWPTDADRTRQTVQREDFRPVAMELAIVAHVLHGAEHSGRTTCRDRPGRGPAGRPGRDPIAGFEPERPRRTVRGCGCWSGSLPSLTWAPHWPRRRPGEAGLRWSAAEPAWARHRSCGRFWLDSTQVSVSWKAPATIC
jgi:hypothetical protein